MTKSPNAPAATKREERTPNWWISAELRRAKKSPNSQWNGYFTGLLEEVEHLRQTSASKAQGPFTVDAEDPSIIADANGDMVAHLSAGSARTVCNLLNSPSPAPPPSEAEKEK